MCGYALIKIDIRYVRRAEKSEKGMALKIRIRAEDMHDGNENLAVIPTQNLRNILTCLTEIIKKYVKNYYPFKHNVTRDGADILKIEKG